MRIFVNGECRAKLTRTCNECAGYILSLFTFTALAFVISAFSGLKNQRLYGRAGLLCPLT